MVDSSQGVLPAVYIGVVKMSRILIEDLSVNAYLAEADLKEVF